MTPTAEIRFEPVETDGLAEREGTIAVIVEQDGKLSPLARKVNRLCKGALARFAESEAFEALQPGGARSLAFPAGLTASEIQVVKLDRRASAPLARKAGAALGKTRGSEDLLVLAGSLQRTADLSLGLALRDYAFTERKSDEAPVKGSVVIMVNDPEATASEAVPGAAITEGVFFTRDLTNEPANYLTTEDFAARLGAMQEIGLDVEILEEPALEDLGMRTLLSVGQGSASPSRVVVMTWSGGPEDEKPLALIGKGVVFDTGGISLKPGAGMENMTMDMGGAGVVAGVMRTLALRKCKANVVGIVGLVENMPSGTATRPGDVITSMKGDTVEVINTDAEGRLVLADLLWYAQERFEPAGMVDLATLTGAIIVGLGHENAGAFSNDDDFCKSFLTAAEDEGEGAWRMPLAPAYDKLLKSRVADMKNVGGRAAGSITAAQFLQRFVKQDVPWIHLDIAGVASTSSATEFAPAGASGWGVRTLNRLIQDQYER